MDTTPGATENVMPEEVQAKEGEGTIEQKEAVPAAPAAPTQHEDFDDVPDPDEDDLDDLDDMLGDFSAATLDPKPAETKKAAQPGAPQPASGSKAADPTLADLGLGDDFSEEEFAKQLQEGMAGLLGELESSPDMQRQFEEMFKQMSDAVGAEEPKGGAQEATPAAGTSTPGGSKAPANEENLSFQETIKRTMERMQSSGEQATAAAAAGGGDDFMAELLKQMSSGDLGGGGEEDFSKMLMGMMEQLTNKEILYEPMKELHDKFPEWIAKNKDKTPAEDLKRYELQQSIVAEIVGKFDQPTYSDDNATDREYIVDRMQKMQAAGSPPSDLVGDMSSAQDAFAGADEQCNPQ